MKKHSYYLLLLISILVIILYQIDSIAGEQPLLNQAILNQYERIIDSSNEMGLLQGVSPAYMKQVTEATKGVTSKLEEMITEASNKVAHHKGWGERLLSPLMGSRGLSHSTLQKVAEQQVSVIQKMKTNLGQGMTYVTNNPFRIPQFLLIAHQTYMLYHSIKHTTHLNQQYQALKKKGLHLNEYEDQIYRIQHRVYEQAEIINMLTVPRVANNVGHLRNLTTTFNGIEMDIKDNFEHIEKQLLKERKSIKENIQLFESISQDVQPSYMTLFWDLATLVPPLFKMTAPLNPWSQAIASAQLVTWCGQYATSLISEARKSSLEFELHDYNALLQSLPRQERDLLTDLHRIRGKLDDIINITMLEATVKRLKECFPAFFWFALTLFLCWSAPVVYQVYHTKKTVIDITTPPVGPPQQEVVEYFDPSTSTVVNASPSQSLSTKKTPPSTTASPAYRRWRFFSFGFFLWTIAFLFILGAGYVVLDHSYAVEVSKLNRAYHAAVNDREKLFQLRTQYRSNCKLQNLSLLHRFSMHVYSQAKLLIFQNPDRVISTSPRGHLINYDYCDSLSRDIASLTASVSSSTPSSQGHGAYDTARSYFEIFQAFVDVCFSQLFSIARHCSFEEFLTILGMSCITLTASFVMFKLLFFCNMFF